MKNRNFAIEDAVHARLKSLAATRRETIGRTIGFLLNQQDRLELGELARRFQAGSIEKQSATIKILENILAMRHDNV